MSHCRQIALFRQDSSLKGGHISSYMCTIYGVNLCIGVHLGLRKTFWVILHSSKELKLGVTPKVPSKSRRSTENSRTGGSSRRSRSMVGPDTASEMNRDANGRRVTDYNRSVNSNGEAVRLYGNDGEEQNEVHGRVTRSAKANVATTIALRTSNSARRTRVFAERRSKRRISVPAGEEERPTQKRRRQWTNFVA